MSQTLQKIEFSDLHAMLASLNANFAIIENSPLFKGIPGTPGDQGNPGNQGPRGSIFILARLSKFIEFADLSNPSNRYTQVLNQGISALNIELINDLITANDPNILKALDLPIGESLMNGDLLILESDMQIYKFNDVTKKFIAQGIVLSNDLNIFQTIDQMVSTALKDTLANIKSQLDNLTFLNYGSKGSRFAYTGYIDKDGTRVPDPFVENVTTYFPDLIGLNHAVTNLGANSQISHKFKHVYFGLSDSLTSDQNLGVQDSYIKTTTVLGSIREYVRKLQLSASQGSLMNANVNPTSEKLPALVVMQNDYNTGILLGGANHLQEPTLGNYASIYKDIHGNLVLKSKFDTTNFEILQQ